MSEDARNNEDSDINIFEKTVLILLDIINLDFRINFDNIYIKGGGDGTSGNDFGRDMSQENMMNDAMHDSYQNDGPGPRRGLSNLTPIAPPHVNNYDGLMGSLLYLWDGGNPGNGGHYSPNGDLLGFAPVELTVPDMGKAAPIKIAKELLSKENIKSVNSLKNLIIEHQSKLTKYMQNPGKYDNLGILKNAPNEAVRNRIIQSRIQHLKHEIKTFHQSIKNILDGK